MAADTVQKTTAVICKLCRKQAFYPFGADQSTMMAYLIEHIRDDLNYSPIYCPQPTCAGSWTSRRLFELHHVLMHPDKDKVPFDQDDYILAREVTKIAKMAFPEVLDVGEKIELLEQYCTTNDAANFIKELHNWDRTIHQQYLFKSAEPYVDEPTDDAGRTPLQQPKSEQAEPSASTTESTSVFLLEEARSMTESPVAQSPLTESTLVVRMEELQSVMKEPPIRSTPVQQPRRTNHVYAKYGIPRVIGSQGARTSYNDSSHSATLDAHGAMQPLSTPQLPGRIKSAENLRRKLSSSLVTLPKKASSLVPTIQSILDKYNIGSVKAARKRKIARPRRQCVLCPNSTKRYLKVSETKHADVHLRRDHKEFRFACLVCCNLKTIFNDVIKIKHLRDIHGIPTSEQKEGIHFHDYTVERGLVEKRRKMHMKCFPPSPTKCTAQVQVKSR